jgi:tetratricopeptide (TPR) repeat protein
VIRLRRVRWALLIAAGVAVLWWAWQRFFADPLAAGLAAYEERAWAKAASEAQKRLKDAPGDLAAWRLLARSEGRQGRDDAAQVIYRQRLGLEAMTAEDFVIAAAGLMHRGQTQQARFALETARVREPNHPEMLQDLARLDFATDRLAEATELAERLLTRRGWEVRGWLLLGQLREKLDDPGGTAEALQRAIRLDPTLAGGASPVVAVQKRLARALLQTNRPADARNHLAAVLARGRDPEASWLLSRALLQQGEISAATAALAQSDGYGDRDPTQSEPAPLVGAARCGDCHSSYHRIQRSSRHAKTFYQTSELDKLPELDRLVSDPGDARIHHAIRHEGGRLQWETSGDGQVMRALVEYAFGSGDVAVTLVGQDAAGGAFELRLSHYGRGGVWDVTTGHASQPADRREYLGRPLGRDGVRRCLECHTTNARIARERSGVATTDRSIGCERCHGPGANHIQAIAGEFPEPAIANPRLASAAQTVALCAACHSPKDLKVEPGDRLAPRFASTSLSWSRCYTESGGSLSCVNCHDPHRDAEKSASFYETRCLACHANTSPTFSLAAHAEPRLPVLPENVRRVLCPVDPAKGCVKCHMPDVDGIVPHTTFSDHHIRVHRQDAGSR